MKPDGLDLIATARRLAESDGSKRPRQSDLRRAVSTACYALFHTMCRNSADLLIGAAAVTENAPAWRQAYRAVNHGIARDACKNQTIMKKFPKEIEDFGNKFVDFQVKRNEADYDPKGSYVRSEVLADVKDAETIIEKFKKAPIKDRRAFVAWVILPNRKS